MKYFCWHEVFVWRAFKCLMDFWKTCCLAQEMLAIGVFDVNPDVFRFQYRWASLLLILWLRCRSIFLPKESKDAWVSYLLKQVWSIVHDFAISLEDRSSNVSLTLGCFFVGIRLLAKIGALEKVLPVLVVTWNSTECYCFNRIYGCGWVFTEQLLQGILWGKLLATGSEERMHIYYKFCFIA